jgi:GAF domain-containing protein
MDVRQPVGVIDAATAFRDEMAQLVRALDVDRCFLYLRDPRARHGRIVACAVRDGAGSDLTSSTVAAEPEDIATIDPLMGWAFRAPEAIFVDDIETAGPEVLDLTHARDGFGHRALVHAPLCDGGLLYGVLEPCVFGQPRTWRPEDRDEVADAQRRLGPAAAAFVRSGGL